MNRREFFRSLGLSALFAPLVSSIKLKAPEQIFYGVDWGYSGGYSGKEIYLVEMSVMGRTRYFSNVDSVWMKPGGIMNRPGFITEIDRNLNSPERAEMKWREK